MQAMPISRVASTSAATPCPATPSSMPLANETLHAASTLRLSTRAGSQRKPSVDAVIAMPNIGQNHSRNAGICNCRSAINGRNAAGIV